MKQFIIFIISYQKICSVVGTKMYAFKCTQVYFYHEANTMNPDLTAV